MFYIVHSKATRPVPDAGKNSGDYLSKIFKDKLTLAWIDKVIDPQFILDACFSALTNQVSDEELEQIWKNDMVKLENGRYSYKNNLEDDFKGPPSTSYFHEQRFLYMRSKKGRMAYQKKKTPPFYEMDKETISKIGKILEELYPDYHSRAMEARELFLGRPKEGSLRNRFEDFFAFED